MDTESRKKALRYFFEKVVGPLGFKFTPDVELGDFLLERRLPWRRNMVAPSVPASRYATTAFGMAHVRTESMHAYRTRLVAGWVEIAL